MAGWNGTDRFLPVPIELVVCSDGREPVLTNPMFNQLKLKCTFI